MHDAAPSPQAEVPPNTLQTGRCGIRNDRTQQAHPEPREISRVSREKRVAGTSSSCMSSLEGSTLFASGADRIVHAPVGVDESHCTRLPSSYPAAAHEAVSHPETLLLGRHSLARTFRIGAGKWFRDSRPRIPSNELKTWDPEPGRALHGLARNRVAERGRRAAACAAGRPKSAFTRTPAKSSQEPEPPPKSVLAESMPKQIDQHRQSDQ
jgi:hypothetical protein